MNVSEWLSNAEQYGDFFSLKKDRIAGVRIANETYELYYRDNKDTELMLYIEEHVYYTFYKFLQDRGWKRIFLTKYLALPHYHPTFVLFAEMREYELRYHFTIHTRIIMDVILSKKKGEVLDVQDAPFFIQEEVRLTYQYMEEYIKSSYPMPLQLEKNFFHFIYEQEHIRYQSVTAWHVRETVWYLYLQFSELKKGYLPKRICHEIITEINQYNWNEAYKVVIWLALLQMMQTQSFMTLEEKTETINWLQQEYDQSKGMLTEEQKKQIEAEGVEII